MSKARLATVILALCVLPACASIVSKNASTTYIQTNPEKARCELHGQDFVRVIETPASINLPSEAAPVTVACKADGFKNSIQTLDTKADGWIWGNILFGGVIGAVVDASRGAGQKYPPQFMVILEPESFSSYAARDSFYDEREAASKAKWEPLIERYRKGCKPEDTAGTDCRQWEKAEKELAAELLAWQEKRAQAVVNSPVSSSQEVGKKLGLVMP